MSIKAENDSQFFNMKFLNFPALNQIHQIHLFSSSGNFSKFGRTTGQLGTHSPCHQQPYVSIEQ